MARTFAGGAATDNLLDSTGFVVPALFTYAGWVWPNSLDTTVRRVWNHESTLGSFVYVTNAKIQFRADFTSGQGEWSCPQPSTGAWAHIAVTFDWSSPSNTPAMYINGAAQTVTLVTSGSGFRITNPYAFRIGNAAAGNRCWDGPIGYTTLWSDVLGAGEIAALAKGSPPHLVRTNSLLCSYMLSGGSPEVQMTGGGGALTVTGTTVTANPPVAAPFKGEDWMPYGTTAAPSGTLLFFLRRQSGGFTEMDLA